MGPRCGGGALHAVQAQLAVQSGAGLPTAPLPMLRLGGVRCLPARRPDAATGPLGDTERGGAGGGAQRAAARVHQLL